MSSVEGQAKKTSGTAPNRRKTRYQEKEIYRESQQIHPIGWRFLRVLPKDSITFNSAITALEKGTRWHAALLQLARMPSFTCRPNAGA